MQSEPYRCNLCEMVFINPEELTKHKTVVHVNKMYQCNHAISFLLIKKSLKSIQLKFIAEKNQYNDFNSDLPAEVKEKEKGSST